MRTIYLNKVRGLVKKYLPLYLFAFLPLLMSCDYIEEADRLIAVDDAHTDTPVDTLKSAVRNVLLEDFTGQRCSNCPTGTEVIEQLQEIYGERLIAVGIHGGPLGFKGTATVLGLATDVGDEYYSHWQLEYQPVGLVDRHGAVNYTEWAKAVRDEMAIPSDVKMEVKAALNGSQIDINVTAEAYNDYTGMLQVWLLEDGITATQAMPDGTNNRNYVHNHVLRTPVNGDWGEAITIGKGEQKSRSYQQAVDEAWNAANLSIVAFVYNDSGVMQAAKRQVIELIIDN